MELNKLLEQMGHSADGDGITIAVHELATGKRVQELVEDLDVLVIDTGEVSSYDRKTNLLGNPELVVDSHAYKTCKTIRTVLPKAKIVLAFASTQGITRAMEHEPDIASFSVTGIATPEFNLRRYSENTFIAFAAGNEGADGESVVNKYQDYVSTIAGADIDYMDLFVNNIADIAKDVQMASYSGHGKGYVDFTAFTEFILPCGTMYNGTSAATPLFAALLGKAVQVFKESTGVSPSVRTMLSIARGHAVDVLEVGKDKKSGWGLFIPPKQLETNELIFTAVGARLEPLGNNPKAYTYTRNGKVKVMDTMALVDQNYRTQLPVKYVVEELGGSLDWWRNGDGSIGVKVVWIK